MKKVKTWLMFIAKYIVYLTKLVYWAIHRFVQKYPRYAIAIGCIVVVAAIANRFSSDIVRVVTTPRPLPLSVAPNSSGFSYMAMDPHTQFRASIGDAKTNEPKVQTVFAGGSTATFLLTDTQQTTSKPTKFGNTVTFKDVRTNVDLSYKTLTNGIKEDIIIKKPSQGNAFTFDLTTIDATPRQIAPQTFGSVFYDKNGRYLFHFAKPFAVDAKGARTDNVVLALHKTDKKNDYKITVIVNEQWLADPARAYPISIDPTVVYSTSSQFAAGQLNHVTDTGSGNSPNLTTYYQELPTDQYTVGLWHLNEASGNALDSSGNSYTGTPTGTTVVTGLMGNARNYNGSSDLVAVGTALSPANITIEAWVYRTSATTNMGIVRKQNAYLLTLYNNTIQAGGNPWAFNDSGVGIELNQWVHVAMTHDNNTLRIYKNGVQVGSTFAASGALASNANLTRIGYDDNGYWWGGMIDEVRISNIARTPEEIKMDAQRRPYGVYTSDVIDLTATSAWNSLSWSELGVGTGDGETPYSTANLVAQWNFNNTSNTTTATNDGGASSCGGTAANCNGTLTNMTTTGQDAAAGTGWTANNKRWGAGAVMFDGTNDTVIAGSESSFDFERTQAFSLSAWVKGTGTNQEIIAKMANSAPYTGYEFGFNGSGKLLLHLINTWTSNAISVTSTQAINDGLWHYVVSTYDGSSSATGTLLYIDGKIATSTTEYNSLSATILNNISVNIGSLNNSAEYFNGTIDAVSIFSRALTASEILSNYNAGNVEFQTRVGTTTDANDGSWEAWKPTTNETQIDSMDGPYLYNTTDTNLKSYWPMDESAINTCSGGANDVCDKKSSFDLTNQNSDTKIINGKFGNGRLFDGSVYYLACTDANCGDTSNLDLPTTPTYSVALWFKTDTSGVAQTLLSKKSASGTSAGYMVYLDSANKVNCNLADGTNQVASISTLTYTDGNWHSVVCTSNGTNQILYVDGTQVDSDASSGVTGTINNAQDFRLGANGGGTTLFKGMIDEVRVFKSTAMTAADVLTYHQAGSTNANTFYQSTDTTILQEGSAAQKIETGKAQLDPYTVSLWHMDETGGTGAYIKDSVTSSVNHGTPTGTTTINGVSAKARSFNGSNDFVDMGNALNPGTGDYSVEFWMKTSQSTLWRAVQKRGTGGAGTVAGFQISGTGGALENTYFSDTANNYAYLAAGTNYNLNDGKWHHVAITWQNSTGTLLAYIDGALRETGTKVGTPAGKNITTTRDFTLGAAWDAAGTQSQFLSGSLDEIRISNIARSAEEIAEAYRAGRDHSINKTIASTDLSGKNTLPFYVAADRPGTYISATIGESAYANYQPDTNTIGLWHLDELSGSGAYLKDASGNGNNGSPTNTTNTQGRIGIGKVFNGTSSLITVPAATSLNITGTITLEAWVRTASANSSDTGIVSKNAGATVAYGLNLQGTGAGANANRPYFLAGATPAYSTVAINDSKWHYVAGTYDGSNVKTYVDGMLQGQAALTGAIPTDALNLIIGCRAGADCIASTYFTGSIDEVRLSNTARTADQIRQAYEVGARTHNVTIDFGAKLDSGNLIADVNDKSFTVDATYYGLSNKGSNLYLGDKIIVRENYNGTTYIAQGTVNGVTASSGAVTVASWDTGSTFPSGGQTGFSVNADVFKWQREYFDLGGSLSTHRDTITNLTFRLTSGNEGRTIWIDDLKSAGNYLTTPAGSTITSSTGNRYFQYRAFLHAWDTAVSSSLTTTTIDYNANLPSAPTMTTPTVLSSSSIQWNFTAPASAGTSTIDAYKLFDGSGNEITSNVTCTVATLTCVETNLSTNTQYTRKVAAHNNSGNGAFSATAAPYTLAAVPTIPTTSSPTATTLSLTPSAGTNPSGTLLAVYQKTGTSCNGSGGNYLAANGTSNGSTAVWQTATTWGTFAVTGLNLETTEYAFCVKAKNGDNVETTFSSTESSNGGFVPINGNFTITQDTPTTTKRYNDGNTTGRYVWGLDHGSGATNDSVLTIKSGVLTVTADDTVAVGSIVFPTDSHGSILLPLGTTTGQIKLGAALWTKDADADGFPSISNKVWYGAQPTPTNQYRRLYLMTTLNSTDCNDASYNTSNACCSSNGTACSGDGDCCSSVCGTDADTDNYFSQSAGHAGTCQATSHPYTDCYDANANAKPGQTIGFTADRGDGSYDYNCDGNQTHYGTEYNASCNLSPCYIGCNMSGCLDNQGYCRSYSGPYTIGCGTTGYCPCTGGFNASTQDTNLCCAGQGGAPSCSGVGASGAQACL